MTSVRDRSGPASTRFDPRLQWLIYQRIWLPAHQLSVLVNFVNLFACYRRVHCESVSLLGRVHCESVCLLGRVHCESVGLLGRRWDAPCCVMLGRVLTTVARYS